MSQAQEAAAILRAAWRARVPIAALPEACRPGDRAAGYAVQAMLAAGETIPGWKIAATSVAGQRHIGVDAPLAGRLFASRMVRSDESLDYRGNAMRLAEAEFAFTLGADLPPRAARDELAEIRAAVASVHPAIELPDSRFVEVARAGAPQLIAECACADFFVLGAAAGGGWRDLDLAAHRVRVTRNGAPACEGIGANVLGDPWRALVWIANELSLHGPGLSAGEVVTTGTCIVPLPVVCGDTLEADFGVLGVARVRLL